MFAGHVGAALAIGRADRRIGAGTLVFAALALDFLLWLFILLGWESAAIPADFERTHQPLFDFPLSHGLAASLGWAVLAGVFVYAACPGPGARRLWPAALVAAAVFSHWLLDALVHVPELPLLGPQSPKAGLGLWGAMPLALAVEALVVVAGLALYLRGSGLSAGRRVGMALLCAVILAFTIVGMTVAPPPPSIPAMAATSLVMVVSVAALAWWLDKPRPRGAA
jgi:uncharacterized membrane protein